MHVNAVDTGVRKALLVGHQKTESAGGIAWKIDASAGAMPKAGAGNAGAPNIWPSGAPKAKVVCEAANPYAPLDCALKLSQSDALKEDDSHPPKPLPPRPPPDLVTTHQGEAVPLKQKDTLGQA